MSPIKYKNPPVQEALCEIFFSGSEWDNTIPGSFYEKIKKDYSEKKQMVSLVQVKVTPQKKEAQFVDEENRLQFRKPDGSQIVQLSQNLLVVNQLKPYPEKFEDWLPVVIDKFDIYCQLAKPKKIEKIGVRYINRIVIPEKIVSLNEYFSIYPRLPENEEESPFFMRIQLPQKHENHSLLMTFATAPSDKPGVHTFALDLYDVFSSKIQLTSKEISTIAKAANENIEMTFEHCISNKLRTLFGEEQT